MRHGRLLFVFFFGSGGFLTVFFASILINEWVTSLFRGFIAFVVAAMIGLIFNQLWILVKKDLT